MLLSDLLTAANYPTGADFDGYIIALCGFPNGHAQYFISDFTHVANGGQAMVIAPGGTRTSPEALNH